MTPEVAIRHASKHLGPSLGLTFLTLCVGHSVALHRGIIHRAFEFSPGVRRGLVWLFVFTGLGGPLSWIRLHYVRDHWQNQKSCPDYFAYRHSLLRDFFWNLHCAFTPNDWSRYRVPAELEGDPQLRFLERTWWLWNLASYAALALVAALKPNASGNVPRFTARGSKADEARLPVVAAVGRRVRP